jgi:hypothetical protein
MKLIKFFVLSIVVMNSFSAYSNPLDLKPKCLNKMTAFARVFAQNSLVVLPSGVIQQITDVVVSPRMVPVSETGLADVKGRYVIRVTLEGRTQFAAVDFGIRLYMGHCGVFSITKI